MFSVGGALVLNDPLAMRAYLFFPRHFGFLGTLSVLDDADPILSVSSSSSTSLEPGPGVVGAGGSALSAG